MITTLIKTKKKPENFALKLWMLFAAKKLRPSSVFPDLQLEKKPCIFSLTQF